MLVIFQDVGKLLAGKELFTGASFDQMFEGLRNTLQSDLINAINVAENNLTDRTAIRLLKILLMVKYIKDFRATIDNLSILLISSVEVNILELKKNVRESLSILERQIYIERHGDIRIFNE